MKLKNILLVGALASALPLAAMAQNLVTVNNGNSTSAVKIVSGSLAGTCTGNIPFGSTPAHSTTQTPWLTVEGLCAGSGATCNAQVFMTKDCSGAPVADVTLTLANGNITSDNSEVTTGPYSVTING